MRIFSKGRVLLAVAAVAAGLAIVPGVKAVSEWGPSRPTFTWAHPATYVTFNSITDNPSVGDERAFYTGYEAGTTNVGQNNLTVRDNEEVSLRVYFHNNAASNLNKVARNTTVKMQLPSGEAADQASVAYISADNANPISVWDSVHLTGPAPFSLEYEKGSAKLFNNVFGSNGTPLSDSIVTSGAQVGYDKIDGNVPGCAQFSGWVVIHVRVHVKPPKVNPSYTCNLLDVTKGDNRTVKISAFNYTAINGATYKSTVLDWGDGSAPLTTNNVVGASHKYAKDSTYKISAVAHFMVNGKEVTASGDSCSKVVTFTTPGTPPSTPPQTPAAAPTKLVNTGPGEVAGIFAAATAAGAILYRRILGRRLSRQ